MFGVSEVFRRAEIGEEDVRDGRGDGSGTWIGRWVSASRARLSLENKRRVYCSWDWSLVDGFDSSLYVWIESAAVVALMNGEEVVRLMACDIKLALASVFRRRPL